MKLLIRLANMESSTFALIGGIITVVMIMGVAIMWTS